MNYLVTLLICLVSVGASRYGDYSRVKMPHYNMDYDSRDAAHLADDYKDHSLDSAPSLDYDYEKEQHDKTTLHDHDEETFKKRSKKKKSLNLVDDRFEVEREDDLIPKLKSNRQLRKLRNRLKPDKYDRENRRYRNNDRSDEIEDVQLDARNDYPKEQLSEGNRIDFDIRFTTEKIIRRKPRDRTTLHDDSDDNEDFRRKDSDIDDMEDLVYGRQKIVAKPSISEKNKYKHYPEYEDYVDMKRVNNIKNKLPGILRHTKVESSATESPNADLHQDITYYRRANVEFGTTQRSTDIKSSEATAEIILNKTTTKISNQTELSLAEKSRLSILRKAQRKESVRNVTWTTKPPVLMLVTPRLHTIVMVEPRADQPLRGKEVFDDSSERIARAKKLMRHKLVAGAKSIHDLTDNWDDMVCDYIDVSLLDSSGARGRRVLLSVVFSSVMVALSLKFNLLEIFCLLIHL